MTYFYTIGRIVDGCVEVELVFSEAEADARHEAHYQALWAEQMGDEPYPETADDAHAVLTGTSTGDDELMWVSAHEVPAIKEALATLHAVKERLEMNNYDGEESPFIEDCDTAIRMLEGAKS